MKLNFEFWDLLGMQAYEFINLFATPNIWLPSSSSVIRHLIACLTYDTKVPNMPDVVDIDLGLQRLVPAIPDSLAGMIVDDFKW